MSVSTRPNDPKLHHTAKFLKPHPKTDKMRFYNSITKEIYESAYVALQTWFVRIRRLKAVLANYEEGLIPKENIMIKRYLQMPADPTQRC